MLGKIQAMQAKERRDDGRAQPAEGARDEETRKDMRPRHFPGWRQQITDGGYGLKARPIRLALKP
jgi:hypothetical protein